MRMAIVPRSMSSDNEGWWPVKIKKEVLDVIDEFMETPEGKRLGFSSRGKVIEAAVREMFDIYFKKRFEHVNTFEDKVRIMDNTLGKNGDIVTVSFRGSKSGFCEYDQSDDCIHVKYAWELPDVAKALKKHGLKPPG